MPTRTALLEQLSSRICHDLISPIGAIGNGLELIDEMGMEMSDDALKLIAHSATQAAAKLATFRMAYGAGGRDPNIKLEDVQKTFGKFISGDGKIKQAWDPYGSLGIDPKTPAFCKILLCGLMLGAECLPRGGIVMVDAEPNGTSTLITAQGTDAVLRDGVAAAMSPNDIDPETLDPRLVHPAMTGVLAARYGYTVQVAEQSQDKVVFRIQITAITE